MAKPMLQSSAAGLFELFEIPVTKGGQWDLDAIPWAALGRGTNYFGTQRDGINTTAERYRSTHTGHRSLVWSTLHKALPRWAHRHKELILLLFRDIKLGALAAVVRSWRVVPPKT